MGVGELDPADERLISMTCRGLLLIFEPQNLQLSTASVGRNADRGFNKMINFQANSKIKKIEEAFCEKNMAG